MGETIDYPVNGRSCAGYLARSDRSAAPGVIVIQEYWGLNEHIQSIADRFAAAGYHALAPDLYHGLVTTEPDEAGKAMMALRIDEAAKDLRGAARYLKELTGKDVGTVGFCMGGALSLFAACENPRDVAACINFYGVHPSIRCNFDALRAPVLGLFATNDAHVSADMVAQLYQELAGRRKALEFVTYPGAEHAFFNDQRPEVYKPEAAEDAWRRALDFFGRHLR